MLSGALKLQELEFEVLPKAWRYLDDAYGLARWVTGSYQEYPSIEGMSDPDLLEYSSKTHPDLLNSQVEKIVDARGKERRATSAWQETRMFRRTPILATGQSEGNRVRHGRRYRSISGGSLVAGAAVRIKISVDEETIAP
jgi:hypothetical protein